MGTLTSIHADLQIEAISKNARRKKKILFLVEPKI